MKSLIVLNECSFSNDQIKLLKNHFKDFSLYTDTNSEEKAIKRVGNKNIVVMDQFMWSLSESFFKECKAVELIILNTTAFDNIPLDLLRKHKVKLVNLKTYATKDVAEVAIGLMTSLNLNLDVARAIVREKNFSIGSYKQSDFVRDIEPGHSIIPTLIRKPIRTQIAGVVGLGHIGREISGMCNRLGMQVLGYNRTPKIVGGVKNVELNYLFEKSDVIFIALKYNPKTMTRFIDSNLLKRAKDDAIFISISPSEIVDVDFLIKNPEKFKGLGFDYYVTDKLIELNKARQYNSIITPHLGHQSEEAYNNITRMIIESAVNFSKGRAIDEVINN